MTGMLARTAHIFTSRLHTLLKLLDRGEAECGIETLIAARLAEDMLPLPYQIVFASDQASHFAAWCLDEPFPRTDAAGLDWAALKRYAADAIALVERAAGAVDDGVFARGKRVDLLDGMYLEFSGADYRDEWLMPNFYFHLVTAYDILRANGVAIGKPDYMAHLLDRIRKD